MAEWKQGGNDGYFATSVKRYLLEVYQGGLHGGWRMRCLLLGTPVSLEATTAEAAKLEALTLVGEWATSLAVEAAELRGRMVGEALDADAIPWDDFRTMIVCEICGNKRCPHATDATRECTGSNEPGQIPKEAEHDG